MPSILEKLLLCSPPQHHSTSPLVGLLPLWSGLSVALCGQVSWPWWYKWHILPSLWENGSFTGPARREERGWNTWDLICSKLPTFWAGFPRAAPTLTASLAPFLNVAPPNYRVSCPHLSQGPNLPTRALRKDFKDFFFFQGKNWTSPSSTHPGSCPCFMGKGLGRTGGTGAAQLLGKMAVGGGQWQCQGGEPSPLCTPHSAPNSPSKGGILLLRASLIAQLVKNPPAMQDTPVWFLGQEDPLEKD